MQYDQIIISQSVIVNISCRYRCKTEQGIAEDSRQYSVCTTKSDLCDTHPWFGAKAEIQPVIKIDRIVFHTSSSSCQPVP